jgi:hypothetical protein
MSANEKDLRGKKRELEQKLSEAILNFERETLLSVTEVIVTPAATTGSVGNQGGHLKVKVELRS